MRVNAIKLSSNPDIFVTQTNGSNPFVGDIEPIAARLEGKSCTCLVVPAFSMHAKSEQNKIDRVSEFLRIRRKFPNVDIIALCNEKVEINIFRNSGIRTCLINQNAFVDERIFHILPNANKNYLAVYNGQMKSFKRHALASDIQDLVLLYYGGAADLEYYNSVRNALPNATFANGGLIDFGPDKGRRFRFLPSDVVVEYYNKSRVGLCLSEVEGAMYASIEYLLCGLPVVSTRNFGGRDEFAAEEYWTTVEGEPRAVRRAVVEMSERRLESSYIRNKTLERMKAHRQKLFDLVDQIFELHGFGSRRFEREFDEIFSDKMWKNVCNIDSLLAPDGQAPFKRK